MVARSLVSLIVMCLCVCVYNPAYARNTQEDVQSLERIFQDLLEQYKNVAQTNQVTLISEGNIMVEPSGSYYAVTLPHLSIKQSDGGYTEIGMIALNAIPGDTAQEWKMTMALPTPMIHYNAQHVPVTTITVGKQNFAGIWHEDIKTFAVMNAQYNDVVVDHSGNQILMTIPELQIYGDMKESGEGLWSGPGGVVLKGLRIDSKKNSGALLIEEIKIISSIKDYSFKAFYDYEEKLNALVANQNSSKKVSGTHVMGLYNMIADFLGNAWDGFDAIVSVKNFKVQNSSKAQNSGKSVMLKDAMMGFSMNGFRSGMVSMGMQLSYGGLHVSSMSSEDLKLMPDHINIDLSINNLPYKEMVDLGRNSVQGIVDAPQAKALVGMNAAMMMPQLLTQAQTNLTLKDSFIENQYYKIMTNFIMTANLQAAMSATGTAKTEIYGLDHLLESLNVAATKPDMDAAKKEKLQKSVAILSIVKMVGQMGKDHQGRDVRIYDMELTEQGQTMLNGTDLKTLMQSLKGTQQ